MAFVQCTSEAEAEKQIKLLKAAFVSEDFRMYGEIEFWDDCSVWTIPAKTLLTLYNLQTQIENMMDGQNEMAWGDDIIVQAKELQASFKDALKAIKFKPIVKSKRG